MKKLFIFVSIFLLPLCMFSQEEVKDTTIVKNEYKQIMQKSAIIENKAVKDTVIKVVIIKENVELRKEEEDEKD